MFVTRVLSSISCLFSSSNIIVGGRSYKHKIELKTLVNRGAKPSSPFMNASGAPLVFAGAHC